MRRTVTIKRLKHFAGFIINYFCILDIDIQAFKDKIVNYDEEDDNESNFDVLSYPIANGKEITIDIDDKEHKLFVLADTSTGTTYSNEIIIGSGTSNEIYEIKTKYSFAKGSSYFLLKK